MAEYIGYSFADDEDDDRKMDSSDRSAGVKKWRKAAANTQKAKRFPEGHRDYGYPQRRYEEYGPPQRSYQEYPEFQGFGPPNNYQVPTSRMKPYRKQRGPCYQCGQLGQIRANCPNRRPPAKEYHSCVNSMKECMTHVCDSDRQNVSEGHHNSFSRSCGVFNTNCAIESDQGFVKVPSKDNATGSPVGTLALHEEREWDPLLIRCWEVVIRLKPQQTYQEKSPTHLP